jgi:anti-anti-sigma factor
LLSNQVRYLFATGTRKLFLNLVNLTQIDSSSTSILAEAYVFLKRHGGGLKLISPAARVREVLSVLQLTEAIPSFEDEAEAQRAFSREPLPQRPKDLDCVSCAG